MRHIFSLSLLSLLLFTLMPAGDVYAHEGATGIIKERMDNFATAKKQMRALRGALQENSFETVTEITSDMLIWADKIKASFPAGSDNAPSEALPSIWEDEAGFDEAIERYSISILTLQKAALAKDANAAMQSYQALGASCSNCHRSYRK